MVSHKQCFSIRFLIRVFHWLLFHYHFRLLFAILIAVQAHIKITIIKQAKNGEKSQFSDYILDAHLYLSVWMATMFPFVTFCWCSLSRSLSQHWCNILTHLHLIIPKFQIAIIVIIFFLCFVVIIVIFFSRFSLSLPESLTLFDFLNDRSQQLDWQNLSLALNHRFHISSSSLSLTSYNLFLCLILMFGCLPHLKSPPQSLFIFRKQNKK